MPQRKPRAQFHGIATVAVLALVLSALPGTAAKAQTPSPLQEWQYPGGIILEKLFAPQVPEWRIILGGAAAWKPIYQGAKPYRVSPGPVVNIRYRDIAFASVGEGAGVNVLRGKNYRVGVALGYDLGRKVSDYPSHLSGLGNIQPAPVIKLFAAYVPWKSVPVVLRADVRRVMGGANGFLGDLEAYIPLPGSSKDFVMFAGPSITFADADYMQHVFGVGQAQSFRSGYPQFKANAGVQAVGFGFSATWFFTEHWMLNGDAAISHLMGSASSSPITEQRTQGMLAVSLAYQF
jgi:outer membrane scaffolding protein for murein synthesis (MipA/OmpV family)